MVGVGVEVIEQKGNKEEELLDVDNGVVIAGRRGVGGGGRVRGINGDGKN